jgi:hypothetical protein
VQASPPQPSKSPHVADSKSEKKRVVKPAQPQPQQQQQHKQPPRRKAETAVRLVHISKSKIACSMICMWLQELFKQQEGMSDEERRRWYGLPPKQPSSQKQPSSKSSEQQSQQQQPEAARASLIFYLFILFCD